MRKTSDDAKITQHLFSGQVSKEQQTMNLRECHLVGDLIFSQEGACATRHIKPVLEISKKTRIHRSSVGRIIPDLSEPPTQKKKCLFGADVFLGSVATQLRWDGRVCMYVEARIIRIPVPKTTKLLKEFQVRVTMLSCVRKRSGHFLRHKVQQNDWNYKEVLTNPRHRFCFSSVADSFIWECIVCYYSSGVIRFSVLYKKHTEY